LTLVWHCEKT